MPKVTCQECNELITKNIISTFFYVDYTITHRNKTGHTKYTYELKPKWRKNK